MLCRFAQLGIVLLRVVLLRVVLLGAVLSFGSVASAHQMPLDLEMHLEGRRLVLLALTTGGAVVSGARFEYVVSGPLGEARAEFKPQGNEYVSAPLNLARGGYNLVIRDRTFEREITEVQTSITWPLSSLRLAMPAAGGSVSLATLLLVLLTPISLVGLALVWVLFLRGGRATDNMSNVSIGGDL